MAEIAARFVRVSTGAQDEASQVPDIDRHIAAAGYTLGPTYTVHGKSASKGKHQADIDRALDDMRSGLYSVLVVWAADRIERRGALAHLQLAQAAREAGGRIEYVKDAYLNVASDFSDSDLARAADFAKYESKRKSERILAKHAALRADKHATGKVPYGYRLRCTVDTCGAVTGSGQACSKSHPKNAEIDPGKAETVRLIFAQYIAGVTLQAIAAELAEAGTLDSAGGTFWAAALGDMIRNPAYNGQARNGAELPRIVDADTWLDAQAASNVRGKRKGRPTGPSALLTGVLSCARCGGPMWRIRVKDRAGTWRAYYRCYGPSKGKLRDACGVMLPLDAVEAEVSRLVLAQLQQGTVTATRAVAARDWAAEISEAELALTRLPLDRRAGRITTAEMIAEQTRLGELIAELETRPPVAAHAELIDTGATSAEHWRDADRDARRAFLIDTGWAFTADRTDGELRVKLRSAARAGYGPAA